eukprot:gene26167-32063_t
MADADEATSALIAQLLAEDDPYGDNPYGNIGGADDSDSDYSGGRKPKKAKKAPKAKAASKASSSRGKQPEDEKENVEDEFTASGRRKRKDTGKKREGGPRAWTAEEERLFLEALELYGREWKKAAAHVGTRDAKAFTSHAQKYFIKCCLQGKPLMPKVAESGEGYTLSGKPLDPFSAAARAYGFKPDTLQ